MRAWYRKSNILLCLSYFFLICKIAVAAEVWTQVTPALGVSGDNISSVSISAGDSTKFYAIVNFRAKKFASGNWSTIPHTSVPNGIPGDVVGLFGSGSALVAGQSNGVLGSAYSANDGASWSVEGTPLASNQITSFASVGSAYYGVDSIGIVTGSSGTFWTRKYTATFGFCSGSAIFAQGGSIYANCDGARRSTDGNSWNTMPDLTTADAFVGDGYTVYARSSGAIYKTTDQGTHWSLISTNYPGVSGGTSAAIAFVNGVLLSQYGTKVYQTSDSGNTWTELPAIGGTITPRPLLMSSATTLYAVGSDYKIYSIPVAPVILATTPGDPATGANSGAISGCGMCVAHASLMAVSLSLNDTPVGYRPAVGPSAYVTISYNQKEAGLPATSPNFSNLGPKWTHSFVGYIEDNAATPGQSVRRIVGGGGAVAYDQTNYNTGTGVFSSPELQSQGILSRTPVAGTATSYTLTLPDGTVYLYNVAGTGTPHRLFLKSITDPQGQQLTLNYTGQKLTSIVDATNRSTTFSYTNSNPLLLTQITDPFGRHADINYDPSGRLSSITDVFSITSSFAYPTTDTTSKLFSFVSAMTTPYGTSSFAYGEDIAANYYWLELTDPLGQTERVEAIDNATNIPPNPTPAPSGVLLASGAYAKNNTYHWDKYAYQLGITKVGGVITNKDYTKATLYHWLKGKDGTKSPILGAVRPAVHDSNIMVDRTVFFNYDNQPADGDTVGTIGSPKIIARVAEDGVTAQKYTISYNVKGFPTNFKDPLNRETAINYALNGIDVGNIFQRTDATTLSTVGAFDVFNYTLHLPKKFTDAAGKIWTADYNGLGQPTIVSNPLGQHTQFSYDTATHKRLLNVTNNNNATVLSLTYDAYDRVRTATDNRYFDSQYYSLTYDYDDLDHITKVTYPDTTTESYSWSFPTGWPNQGCPQCPVPQVVIPSLDVWKVTDRIGRTTDLNYDRNRQLTSVTENVTVDGASVLRTTAYEYYPNGALANLVDAAGTITHWDIDIQGKVTGKVYDYCRPPAIATCHATSSRETYTYDVLGRLKTVTDALNQVKTYSYNLDNSIAGYSYSIPGGLPSMANVSFGYDPWFPRVTSMVDGSGLNGAAATTTFDYVSPGTACTPPTVVTNCGALQLKAETNSAHYNQHVGYFYDAAGRLSQRWAAESMEGFSYDSIGRLSSYSTDLGTFSLSYLGQTGQVSSRSVTNGGVTVTTNYGYDTNTNDRRLLSIGNGAGGVRSYALSYAANPLVSTAKNPYTIAGITESGTTTPWVHSWSYGYDASDRLLSASAGAGDNYVYGYDKLDNAVKASYPSYTDFPTYNVLNQQTQNAFWQDYDYDAAGNLTAEKDNTSGNAINRAYKYDMEGRLVEMNDGTANYKVKYVYDGLGRRLLESVTTGGSTVTKRNLWCGSTLCQLRDTTTLRLKRYFATGEYDYSLSKKYLYRQDHLGSVRDLVDASTGLGVGSQDFDPYGNSRNAAGIQSDYRYAGLLWAQPIGLYLSATRAYDPGTTRWMTRDWIREAGGINIYGYVGGNPIMRTDRMGTKFVFVATPGDQKLFWDAFSYLEKSPTIAPIIRGLRDDPSTTYKIVIGNSVDNQFSWSKDAVFWNPYSGLRIEGTQNCPNSTAYISPALALGHELIHADHGFWGMLFNNWNILVPPKFGNFEELRTIALEQIIAKELGEGVRRQWINVPPVYPHTFPSPVPPY